MISIRPFRPDDTQGFLDCFNAIFPTADGKIAPIDRRHWDWKYADNPLQRVEIMVAEHETRGIVGAYPCQPLTVWVEGNERLASQITDLMVLPEFRRAAPRPGLFVALGNAFHESYCGSDPDRQLFTYGWPVPAWRVGQRYLRYENIRDWNVLAREFEQPSPAPEAIEIVEVARFGPEVDALWQRVRTDIGLSLSHDHAYLNWRYADRPGAAYRLFECRDRDGLRAIFVYGIGDFVHDRTPFLIDWVVAADDDEAIAATVSAAERRAAEDGKHVLGGVFSPIDPRFHKLQRRGFLLYDSHYFIVVASFKHDTAFFRDRWVFTMGDSDLI